MRCEHIIFTFSGIILNTLVIVSIWKSSQLRKKLCHFMIMVLSCSDLATVLTNHSGILVYLISWLIDDSDLLFKMRMYQNYISTFIAFSFHVLLVMNIERYLGAYYPIFHRTSVTRRRLLSLLAILVFFHITLFAISTDDIIISRTIVLTLCIIVTFPPLVFINFKLFKISREVRRRKATLPEKRTTLNLKSISTCLLVAACLVVLSIVAGSSIVFNINIEKNKEAYNIYVMLTGVWVTTIFTMDCTFNSLIFFWKNKVLRIEGMKILKALKDCLVGS